ncbi:hypothetical protein [Persicitalea jodogahamensis]|uniref:Tryptophan-rich sensory protein n=1 Tax=Persicitalea jodogahamensis TaxID=402147 RepID=A0A8J3DBZ7_9BACT|nr:hypothetical protein [Persicitalea jodogahamensis]GHB81589.1 hypothetical protein GCM10007390_40610 [Persicitalea jodogahamensis]
MITTTSTPWIKTLQILNIAGYLLMILMNFLANFLPINGQTTGELSDKYPNLFVPAGVTFSIWGIIYLLLLVFTVYQAQTLFSGKPSRINTIVSQVGIWYFVSSLMNSLWIVLWHYEFLPVSVVTMLFILLSLLLTNFGIVNVNNLMTRKEKFLTKAPFGVYLGWICVATIANVTAWLTGVRWFGGGLEQDSWAVIMLVIGLLIALFAAIRLQNGYLTLAVAWAFAGIVLKRLEVEPFYYSIAFIAGAGAGIALIVAFVLIIKQNKPDQYSRIEATPLYE